MHLLANVNKLSVSPRTRSLSQAVYFHIQRMAVKPIIEATEWFAFWSEKPFKV